MKKATSLLLFISFLLIVEGFAQSAGDLDSTFGIEGFVISNIGTSSSSHDVAVQPDGKIVAAGYAHLPGTANDFAIVRYLQDGILDNSFSEDGIQTVDFNNDDDLAYAVVIQTDGKIITGGQAKGDSQYYFGLVRLNVNGTPDSSFGDDGLVIFRPGTIGGTLHDLIIQPDGKILAAGNSIDSTDSFYQSTIIRFNENGSLDSSFATNGLFLLNMGYATTTTSCISLQPDNKIVVGGTYTDLYPSDFLLARLHPDGSLDTTFNETGIAITDLFASYDYLLSIIVQPDGSIIGAGTSYDNTSYRGFGIAKWTPNGTIDTTFGIEGKLITEFDSDTNEGNDDPGEILLQVDGKIIITGWRYDFLQGHLIAIARYLPDGSLDSSFGDEGKVISNIEGNCYAYSAALQADGKIVVTGGSNFHFLAARYLNEPAVHVENQPSCISEISVAPNPLSETTQLTFTLSEPLILSIHLIDNSARKIKTFIEHVSLAPGYHEQLITFPNELSSGNYYIVIKSQSEQITLQIAVE